MCLTHLLRADENVVGKKWRAMSNIVETQVTSSTSQQQEQKQQLTTSDGKEEKQQQTKAAESATNTKINIQNVAGGKDKIAVKAEDTRGLDGSCDTNSHKRSNEGSRDKEGTHISKGQVIDSKSAKSLTTASEDNNALSKERSGDKGKPNIEVTNESFLDFY